MGRKKRAFLSDDSSSNDSDNDNDYEEQELNNDDADERALFEDPYQQRKRRRLNGKSGKDDALYGVFGDDDDEGPIYRRAAPKRKTKMPVFQKSTMQTEEPPDTAAEPMDEEEGSSDEEGSSEEEESDESSDSEGVSTKKKPTRETLDDEDEDEEANEGTNAMEEDIEDVEMQPRRGGIGSGFGRGGIGSASLGGADDTPPSGQTGPKKMSFAPAGQKGPKKLSFAPAKESSTSLQTETRPEEPQPSSSRGGIGMRSAGTTESTLQPPASSTPSNLPSAFGATRVQRAFLRNDSPQSSTPGTPQPVQLSYEERSHFQKISGGFGARMMAKMGWQAGTGLGAQGQGIVTPIESKLRPKGNVGIAFGGFKERTKQALDEDKRKGKDVEDYFDDGEKPSRGKKGKAAKGKGLPGQDEGVDKSDAWTKKAKPKKIQVVHKTYEEIVKEAGLEEHTRAHQAGVGPIIDATGASLREVSSIAELTSTSWTPSTDSMRIPEIRHNLRLMVDMTNQDLQGLAREGKLLQEKRKKDRLEEAALSKKVKEEAELIRRMGELKIVVDELGVAVKEAQQVQRQNKMQHSDYEPTGINGDKTTSTLDSLSLFVERFTTEFAKEYDSFKVDEILVGAIAPLFTAEIADWKPLEHPSRWTKTLHLWRSALKMAQKPKEEKALVKGFYGADVIVEPQVPSIVAQTMTPWEALLWHVWLPRVRSAINNEWDPADATPAVALYEAWVDIIPPFLQDNIMDQLIIPKVQRAVSTWKPPKPSSTSPVHLHSIVFPWLPFVGLRMQEFMEDARRKAKNIFRSVDILHGVPDYLLVWKQIFDDTQWEDMVLKYIVPKLGSTLREFDIDPANQPPLDPLNAVTEWYHHGVIRSSIMSQLLEREFFPKWMAILHTWLTQPDPSFEEIAQWYTFWKSVFPANVSDLKSVKQGFESGIGLMSEAMNLEDSERMKLSRPSIAAKGPSQAKPSKKDLPAMQVPSRQPMDVTFKSVVEEYAANHNLLFMPLGKMHEKSRQPLYRVTARSDGRGGIVVYLSDDMIWEVVASKGANVEMGDANLISTEEMVLLASKAR